MFKRLIQPHSLIVTLLIFLFIWFLDFIRLNMHYLDPFNNSLKDYEITDIVYANLSRRPQSVEEQVVLVNCGQPDRSRIAALVDKLTAAGARVIGLDLLFTELHGAQEDTLLQQSLKKAGNVVLACELHEYNRDFDHFESRVGVNPFFAEHAALGYVNFPANATKTIRLFSPQEMVQTDTQPAFATAIVQQYAPEAVQRLLARKNKVERIFYRGDKSDFIRYEQAQVLDSLTLPELTMAIAGKIVLVGYVAEDVWANPLTDRHYTPLNKNYQGKSIPDMYGVVIHANVISMILQSKYIREAPAWLDRLLSVLFCYFNVLLIHWIYKKFHAAFHGITRALQIVEFILLFLVIALLFYFFRLRLEFSLGILALLLAYDIIMIYESLIKKRAPWLADLPGYLEWKTAPTPDAATDSADRTTTDPPVAGNQTLNEQID